MEVEKDCKLIFCDKRTYDFNSKDLAKALAWSKDKNVWAISTPWGVLQPMDKEAFENVSSAMFEDHSTDATPEDLLA